MYELITIDVSSDRVKGLGAKKYVTHPRVGEWVEMEVEEKGVMFEVVMVAHSCEGHGSDVYVKEIGPTVDAINSICKK